MSRAIQVRVSESVVRTIHVEDGVQSPLEMLPVLPPDRMADLLGAELEKQGFLRDGKIARRKDKDGIEITVDLESATVTVKVASDSRVAEEVELRARTGIENQQRAEEQLRDAAITELDKRIAERTEQLRREVTGKLEQKLGELRQELDGAIGKATVAALTERAGQLGSIQEIASDDAGNVTIKVKI